ncbi:hypothetical protein ACQP3J_30865, partial [Escherichia coli]
MLQLVYHRNEFAISIMYLYHAPFGLLLSGTIYANVSFCDVMIEQKDLYQCICYFFIAFKSSMIEANYNK